MRHSVSLRMKCALYGLSFCFTVYEDAPKCSISMKKNPKPYADGDIQISSSVEADMSAPRNEVLAMRLMFAFQKHHADTRLSGEILNIQVGLCQRCTDIKR